MVGVELVDHERAVRLEQEAFRRGLVMLTAGEAVVRLSPTLVVTREQIDIAIDILDGVLATMAA
jgi:4-aminobutyrate aminotransferase-like enzyme